MSSASTAQKPLKIDISEKEPIGDKKVREVSLQTVSQQPDSASSKQAVDEEAIRQRAYEIYASRGFQDGSQEADWLEAEEQLRSEH